MATFLKVILVLLVIGVIVGVFQFLWSILPIIGVVALVVAIYFTYKAYKQKESSQDTNVLNVSEFNKNRNIAIALAVASLICFIVPKGPSMSERAETQRLEEEARKEEREAKKLNREKERVKIEEDLNKQLEEYNEEDKINKDFQKAELIEVDYPTIIVDTKPDDDYRGEMYVDLVGLAYTQPGWNELNEEDYNDYVKSVTTLLEENDFYIEEKYYHSGEVYYVEGFVWLELPDDPYNPTVDEVMTKSLNGWVLRNGYNAVTTDDEYNPFEEEFKKIENENFNNGIIKWWDRVHDIGKNPETGEIIKSEE